MEQRQCLAKIGLTVFTRSVRFATVAARGSAQRGSARFGNRKRRKFYENKSPRHFLDALRSIEIEVVLSSALSSSRNVCRRNSACGGRRFSRGVEGVRWQR